MVNFNSGAPLYSIAIAVATVREFVLRWVVSSQTHEKKGPSLANCGDSDTMNWLNDTGKIHSMLS